jgi:hypothetical protein
MLAIWVVTMIVASIMIRKGALFACESNGSSCKGRIIRWLRTHHRPGKAQTRSPIVRGSNNLEKLMLI